MDNHPIWMVRAGQNAAYADDFIDQKFVGIGFANAGTITLPIEKAELENQISSNSPSLGPENQTDKTS